MPGTWCCRPRCEKPRRRSLHKHFRLSSSSWSSSAGADPLPWRMKAFINLGDIFFFFFVLFNVILKALIQEAGLAFPEVLLNTCFLHYLVAVSFMAQPSTESRMTWGKTDHSFSPCPTVWPLRQEIWWGEKRHHLLSPPWRKGQMPLPQNIFLGLHQDTLPESILQAVRVKCSQMSGNRYTVIFDKFLWGK